jgi:hypothetical protein
MSIDNGGPAFPIPGQKVDFGNGWIEGESGMTLRDYFAAKAMQGILASEDPETSTNNREATARTAYEYADAMLAARGKTHD